MSKTSTIKLTQNEMEVYLSQRDYDIVRADASTIDPDKVITEAQKLGFSAYKLSGDGNYADAFMFIKEINHWDIKRTISDNGPNIGQGQNEHGEPVHFVWGRMGMSGYLTQKEVDVLNNSPRHLSDFIKQGVFHFDGDTYFPDALKENEIIDCMETSL